MQVVANETELEPRVHGMDVYRADSDFSSIYIHLKYNVYKIIQSCCDKETPTTMLYVVG